MLHSITVSHLCGLSTKKTPPQTGEWSIVMTVSVCPFVCPRADLWNYTSDLHQFLCMLPMAVARSSSGGVAIRYVFTVSQMASYLHVNQGCSTSRLTEPKAACAALGLAINGAQ